MKLQQFSGPVMAKGVEDTAFYRYNRFVALNEVGGAPERFGIAPSLFHKANAQRAERWPHAMLATATHDTKRGEDARARLAVLSEVPEEWRRQVASWSRLLRARLGDVEGSAPPDRDDEYMFYQMLVGSWPMEMLEAPTAEGLEAYRSRIHAALEKALREGKLRSNWAAPNLEYEAAMQAFAAEALRPEGGFLASFLPFVERIARLGVQNSLVQTALKLTAPGVPDIYQGCELWDLSLVDPDNRRAVDYREREAALAKLGPRLEAEEERAELFEALLATWRDGRIKLAMTALLLGAPARARRAFRRGRLSSRSRRPARTRTGPSVSSAPPASAASRSWRRVFRRCGKRSRTGGRGRNCLRASGSTSCAGVGSTPTRRWANGSADCPSRC